MNASADNSRRSPSGWRRIANRIAAGAVLLLLTSPILFDLYRTMVFGTTPRTDYAGFVLWLAGRGGAPPPAPFAYRILSVAPAVPIFFVAPLVLFSKAPSVSPDWARATLSLAVISYLGMAWASLAVYAICRRLRLSAMTSVAALLGCYLCFGFTAATGVDPLAIAVIATLISFVDRPALFACGLLVGTFVNEKIPLTFAGVLLARTVQRRRLRPDSVQVMSALVGLVLYALAVAAVRAPGNEHQLDLSTWVGSTVLSVREALSSKGLVLDTLPIALLLSGWWWARRSYRQEWTHLRRADLVAVPLLALSAMAARVHFNVGRVAMYAFPFILPVVVTALDARFAAHEAPSRRSDL